MATTAENLNSECSLDIESKVSYEILSDLLASEALDLASEARDCLENFEDYEWQMIPGKDSDRFETLRDKGNEGIMTLQELNEFMGIVSQDGQFHLYYSLWIGHQIVADFNRRLNTNTAEQIRKRTTHLTPLA